MCMNRRDFLKKSILATAGSHAASGMGLAWITSFANQVLAAERNDINFVLIRVPGAMDNILGLSPWMTPSSYDQHDLFLGYEPAQLNFNLEGTQITLGPSAKSIEKFAKEMAIIRGIVVGSNDLGHPFAIQHMASGWEQESAPYWTANISAYRRASEKFLVTNSVVPFGATKPTSLLLTQTLQSENGFERSESLKGLDLIKKPSEAIKNFRRLMSDSERSRRYQEALAAFPDRRSENFALAALYSGISNVAQIDIIENSQLDTHLQHFDVHPSSQAARWNRIAGFLDGLKKFGLLEKTLVLVTTEFTRTPGLNDNGGKDHNYNDNSVALFGYGINGGSAVGDRSLVTRSKDFADAYMVGKFVDFNPARRAQPNRVFEADLSDQIKAAREGKEVTLPEGIGLIRPRDVWATVVAILDPKMGERLPKGSAALPGIVKGL